VGAPLGAAKSIFALSGIFRGRQPEPSAQTPDRATLYTRWGLRVAFLVGAAVPGGEAPAMRPTFALSCSGRSQGSSG
jgi:hypothetical protein